MDTTRDEFCAAVTARIDRFDRTMESGNNTADRFRQLLSDHQPHDATAATRCNGPHEASTPWPCREIRRLNDPTTYPTNIKAASRWLDVIRRMRDMISAAPDQAIDNLEYQLRAGGPNADYNRRFAFSAFTMPFTYARPITWPRAGSEADAALAPVAEAADRLLTEPDIRLAMHNLNSAMTATDAALLALIDDPEPASLSELVDEMKRSVNVSALAALLGTSGITKLANAEFAARLEELKYPPVKARWVELAREPVSVSLKKSATTVSIEEIFQAATPGVQGMLQAARGQVEPPRKTEVQRAQGAQWVSFIFAEWNDHYRFELAKVWGCSHRDYLFPFFGELAKVRNDFIHNGGVAKRATANCSILKWFQERQEMFLTPPMYIDVIQEWPWSDLLEKPLPAQDSRNQYPGRAPISLIDEVQRCAGEDGMRPDDVLEAALQLWLCRKTSS